MSNLITKSIRVTKEESDLLKLAASSAYLPESALVKSWLREKLAEFRINKAVSAYKRSDTISLGKAAEIAGVSTREMMRILAEHDVSRMPHSFVLGS